MHSGSPETDARCAGRRRIGEAMRPGLTTAMLLACVLVVSACSSSDPDAEEQPSAGASASSAPPAPAAPGVGSCHELSLDEATNPVDSGQNVPCGQPHTAVTIKVGKLDALADG